MSEEFKDRVTDTYHAMSNDIAELFNAADVQNANEALTVLLHACMLQYGFNPKDVSNADKYSAMPKDWKAKEVFKMKYVHFCCSPFTCCVTCVPLYNNLSFHGIISDVECSESIELVLKISEHLHEGKPFSNASEVFCNVEELSRYLKDNFSLPLLNLLHETHGQKRLYGFPGLFDDLKTNILQLLPVGSVLSMSAVSKNLHELANSNLLWKYLFKRDCCKGGIPDVDTSSSNTDWKELYKKDYVKKKRRPERRIFMVPRQRMPQLYSIGPDYDSDLGINFDPPFYGPGLFEPFLSSHLPPHFFTR